MEAISHLGVYSSLNFGARISYIVFNVDSSYIAPFVAQKVKFKMMSLLKSLGVEDLISGRGGPIKINLGEVVFSFLSVYLNV